jgi:hypothetical protein
MLKKMYLILQKPTSKLNNGKIPLIQLAGDCINAKLSNILDYQAVPIFCSRSYIWATTSSAGSSSSGSTSVFSGVFTGEEVYGVANKGSTHTTIVAVQTLLETFLNTSLKSACFINEAFPGKKKNFLSWDYSPQVPDYEDFWIT